MSNNRVTGYVIGSDPTSDGLTWKVKVTDKESVFCGQKMIVASTQNGIALAQGLSVSFLIGVFQSGQETYHKAIDVTSTKPKVRCAFCQNSAELAIEVSGSESDSAEYLYTCLPNIPAALTSAKSITVSGMRKVLVRNLLNEDSQWERLHY